MSSKFSDHSEAPKLSSSLCSLVEGGFFFGRNLACDIFVLKDALLSTVEH